MSRLAQSCSESQQMIERSWQSSDDDPLRAAMTTRLQTASKMISLNLTESQIARALAYAELLLKWNQTTNLTAIRTLEGVVDKHFLDSFAIVGEVYGSTVIDLGSGTGFPGIAVAIARPDVKIVLLDAKDKKVQFLRHAIATLGFANVRVIHQRIQELSPESEFDTVLARGLGSVSAIAELALPLLSPGGCVIAMKGKYPAEEISALKTPCQLLVKKLDVPYLVGERHCVILKRPVAFNS